MNFEDIGGGYAKAPGGKVWFLGEEVDFSQSAEEVLQLENIGNGYAQVMPRGTLLYMGSKLTAKKDLGGAAVVIDADWIKFGRVYLRRGEEYSYQEAARVGCKVGQP
jgi:hypothetical protein